MSKNNSVQRPANSRIYASDPPQAEMRLIEEVKRLSAGLKSVTKERDEARRTVRMCHEEGTKQLATVTAERDEKPALADYFGMQQELAAAHQQIAELREALEHYQGRAILGISVADEALARTAPKEEV